jgi:curli biogenesis system outer membrane secretion channel CsgG
VPGEIPAADRATLKQYLLGQLSTRDEDAVEDRYMADDGYFSMYQEVESALIRNFAAGNLDPLETRLFEQNYLITDERRQRASIVRALQATRTERPPAGLVLSRAAWKASLAFALLILVAIPLFFIGRLSRVNDAPLSQTTPPAALPLAATGENVPKDSDPPTPTTHSPKPTTQNLAANQPAPSPHVSRNNASGAAAEQPDPGSSPAMAEIRARMAQAASMAETADQSVNRLRRSLAESGIRPRADIEIASITMHSRLGSARRKIDAGNAAGALDDITAAENLATTVLNPADTAVRNPPNNEVAAPPPLPAEPIPSVAQLPIVQFPPPAANPPSPSRGRDQSTPGRKTRIAVLSFDSATVQTQAAAILGAPLDVGKSIADLLVKRLSQDGRYEIVASQRIDRVLTEQGFSNSNRAEPNSAARLARLLGVDAIIIGSITRFGSDDKTTGTGGAMINGIAGGLVKRQRLTKAAVEIDARVVNPDSSEILAVVQGRGEASRSSTSLLGAGATIPGSGSGTVNMASSNFGNTVLGEAVNLAVSRTATSLEASSTKMPAHAVISSVVTNVTGDTLTLNVGTRDGVRVGDTFEISHAGREIRDPATGKVMQSVERALGAVTITNADEFSATGTFKGTGRVQVGDTVRR